MSTSFCITCGTLMEAVAADEPWNGPYLICPRCDGTAVAFNLCDHCDIPDTELTLYISERHCCCWLCDICLDEMFGTLGPVRVSVRANKQ